MIAYIVIGCSGEWEDYSSWNVKCFKSKEKAEQLVSKLNELVGLIRERKYKINPNLSHYGFMDRAVNKLIVPLDPKAVGDEWGISYHIDTVDFEA